MRPFKEVQSKATRVYAQSGRYHTMVESRVRLTKLNLNLVSFCRIYWIVSLTLSSGTLIKGFLPPPTPIGLPRGKRTSGGFRSPESRVDQASLKLQEGSCSTSATALTKFSKLSWLSTPLLWPTWMSLLHIWRQFQK